MSRARTRDARLATAMAASNEICSQSIKPPPPPPLLAPLVELAVVAVTVSGAVAGSLLLPAGPVLTSPAATLLA
jgi:hypothetical protein